MGCGVGRRSGLDPTLLWRRPVATAPIRPLVWELPYTAGAALEKLKKKKKKKKKFTSEFDFSRSGDGGGHISI